MKENILWVYIVLLLVGGAIGFFKGKSKISLISSVIFAVLLSLSLVARYVVNIPYLSEILLVMLLVVFAIRLAKTKKFMPSGLMLAITALTLVLRALV